MSTTLDRQQTAAPTADEFAQRTGQAVQVGWLVDDAACRGER